MDKENPSTARFWPRVPAKPEPENGTSPTDVFATDPFFTAADPFGMADFGNKGGNESSNTSKINGFLENGFDAFNTNGNSNYNSNVNLTNGSLNLLNSSTVNYNNMNNLFTTTQQNNNMTSQNNLANNLKAQPQQIENALQFLDKKIEEMKVGFSRGILNDDFPLESLDPLKSS